MKATVYFKDGKLETLNIKGLTFGEGSAVDLALTKKMIRPPDKHYLTEVSIELEDIKKIEVIT
jgi:hypothetical protein